MEKLLKEFNVPAKHASEKELSSWRNYVNPVKNPSRRFRYVANLAVRSAVQEQRAKIREKLQACCMLDVEVLNSTDAGDDQGIDVFSEGARGIDVTLHEAKEAESPNKVHTVGCGNYSVKIKKQNF